MTPAYLLVTGKTFDLPRMTTYARALPPIYARHDGYYLAIGGAGRGVTWLEGPWRDRSMVLARFPSAAHVQQFWWGDDYRAAARLRDQAGAFSVLQIDPGSVDTGAATAGCVYLMVLSAVHDAGAYDEYAETFVQETEGAGATLLASPVPGLLTALEGDTVFDRIAIARWPSATALDAFLQSPAATMLRASRDAAAFNVVVRIDGAPPPVAT